MKLLQSLTASTDQGGSNADASPAGLKNADPRKRDDICHVEVTFLKVAMN